MLGSTQFPGRGNAIYHVWDSRPNLSRCRSVNRLCICVSWGEAGLLHSLLDLGSTNVMEHAILRGVW
jgi:hypothetical protein